MKASKMDLYEAISNHKTRNKTPKKELFASISGVKSRF